MILTKFEKFLLCNCGTYRTIYENIDSLISHNNTNNNDITTASINNSESHPEGPRFNIKMKDFGCYLSLVMVMLFGLIILSRTLRSGGEQARRRTQPRTILCMHDGNS